MKMHPDVIGKPGAQQIWLKRLTKANLPAVIRQEGNATVMRYIIGRPRIGPELQKRFFTKLQNFINPAYQGGDWHIMYGYQIAGSACLVAIPGTNQWQVGYALHPDFFGRGIATRVGKLLVHTAFTVYQYPVLYGLTHPKNRASQKVLQRAGLQPAGTAYVEAYHGICTKFILTRQQYLEHLAKRR